MMAMRGDKEMILNEKQIESIDYANIEQYDFTETLDTLRPKILGGYLSFCFLQEYNDVYKRTKKSLSQNMYARRYLNISPMGFSTYKTGDRTPMGENLDNLAEKLGAVIYDIVGVPRKMPRDKDLRDFNDMWQDLKDKERRELIELAKKYINNRSNIVAA